MGESLSLGKGVEVARLPEGVVAGDAVCEGLEGEEGVAQPLTLTLPALEGVAAEEPEPCCCCSCCPPPDGVARDEREGGVGVVLEEPEGEGEEVSLLNPTLLVSVLVGKEERVGWFPVRVGEEDPRGVTVAARLRVSGAVGESRGERVLSKGADAVGTTLSVPLLEPTPGDSVTWVEEVLVRTLEAVVGAEGEGLSAVEEGVSVPSNVTEKRTEGEGVGVPSTVKERRAEGEGVMIVEGVPPIGGESVGSSEGWEEEVKEPVRVLSPLPLGSRVTLEVKVGDEEGRDEGVVAEEGDPKPPKEGVLRKKVPVGVRELPPPGDPVPPAA